MTQNPYAQPAGFDTGPVASRTSVAAILSLVCALVCFVPGLSILAIILGIAAIVMIGSSQGRVTGKGLAISGILIGLLVTVAYGGMFLVFRTAATAFGKEFIGPTSSIFQSLEKQDYATARTLLNTPAGSPAPTDEQFDAFVAAYHAEAGTFQSMPTGILDFMMSFQKVQGFYQPSSSVGQMPVPSEFSNGPAVVLLEFPQGSSPGPAPNPSGMPIVNIGVHSPSQNTVWLIPKSSSTPVGTPNLPSGSQTPPPPPAAEEETTPSGNGG